MAIGSVQGVLVCSPLAVGPSVAPCFDAGGVSYAPVVVDSYLVTPAGGSALELMSAPLDVGVASAFFGFGFVGVVGMWFLGKTLRMMLKAWGVLL